MLSRTLLPLLFLSFAACTAPKDDDDTAGTETDADTDTDTDSDTDVDSDTDTDADTDVDTTTDPTLAHGTVSLVDFFTQAPVSGATLSVGSRSYTTDSTGTATIGLDMDVSNEITITDGSHLDTHLFLSADEAEFAIATGLISASLVAAVESAFTVEYDATLGTVIVSAYTPDGTGGFIPAAGADIQLDASIQGAVVQQGDGTFAAGTTLLDGGEAFVAFANVTPGAVNVTITPPDGMTGCVTAPSTQRFDTAVTAYANSATLLLAICM